MQSKEVCKPNWAFHRLSGWMTDEFLQNLKNFNDTVRIRNSNQASRVVPAEKDRYDMEKNLIPYETPTKDEMQEYNICVRIQNISRSLGWEIYDKNLFTTSLYLNSTFHNIVDCVKPRPPTVEFSKLKRPICGDRPRLNLSILRSYKNQRRPRSAPSTRCKESPNFSLIDDLSDQSTESNPVILERKSRPRSAPPRARISNLFQEFSKNYRKSIHNMNNSGSFSNTSSNDELKLAQLITGKVPSPQPSKPCPPLTGKAWRSRSKDLKNMFDSNLQPDSPLNKSKTHLNMYERKGRQVVLSPTKNIRSGHIIDIPVLPPATTDPLTLLALLQKRNAPMVERKNLPKPINESKAVMKTDSMEAMDNLSPMHISTPPPHTRRQSTVTDTDNVSHSAPHTSRTPISHELASPPATTRPRSANSVARRRLSTLSSRLGNVPSEDSMSSNDERSVANVRSDRAAPLPDRNPVQVPRLSIGSPQPPPPPILPPVLRSIYSKDQLEMQSVASQQTILTTNQSPINTFEALLARFNSQQSINKEKTESKATTTKKRFQTINEKAALKEEEEESPVIAFESFRPSPSSDPNIKSFHLSRQVWGMVDPDDGGPHIKYLSLLVKLPNETVLVLDDVDTGLSGNNSTTLSGGIN